jgi:hypothetical protein
VGTGAADFGGLVGAFHIDPNRGGVALTRDRSGNWLTNGGDQRAACRSGNPLLQQKAPSQSTSYTAQPRFAGPLTAFEKLWITAPSRARATYNPAAPRRTFPQ